MPDRSRTTPPERPSRLRGAGIIVCLGMAASVLISNRLWLTDRDFPMTPVWDALAPLALAPPLDTMLLVVFLASLAVAAASGRRVAFGVCFVLAAVLALPDMQRWQPWFFQYTFMFGALAFCRAGDAVSSLRVIVAFTYIYSGLQKVHAAYFDGGMSFFLEPFGLAETLSWMSYVAPFVEFGVGVGLLIPAVRSFAAVSAVGMHTFLLVCLSPLGQDWNPVVWPWNVAMSAFVLVLFFRVGRSREGATLRPARLSPFRGVVVLLFAVMPAFGLIGAWPSYLSASLYSFNTERATVFWRDDYVAVSELTQRELETPAYPEDAVFYRVVTVSCERNADRLAGRPVMEIDDRPGFLTGERESRLYDCSDPELRP